MKISEKIKRSQKPLFSFELLPPLRGRTIENVYSVVESLMEFNPAYINVTHHRDEVVYKEREDGLLEKKILKKRPGTIALSAAIKYKFEVDVVPHLICAGFSREETEYALIEMNFLGLDDVFALRGDLEPGNRQFIPEKNGHARAVDLVKQIRDMNMGQYLDSDLKNSTMTDFCIGVAGYPEKHVESPNLDIDIEHLKKKVDAGASYIVTQLFFENNAFFRFAEKCRESGIDVPIIPGIKPVTCRRDSELLPRTFNIDFPIQLAKDLENCRTQSEIEKTGIDFSVKQTKELIEYGVPGIHFYTLGKPDTIRSIIKEIY